MSFPLSNLHTHTVLCDGNNTAQEMAEAACAKGFVSLGFSGHSCTPFDLCWCMTAQGTEEYCRQVRALKKQYQGKMEILLGIEQDYYSVVQRGEFDFIIGSLHYLRDQETGVFYPVEDTPQGLEACINRAFHGDVMAFVRRFYQVAAEAPHETSPDIVGHFDIIKKLNQKNRFFDQESREYRTAALEAITRAAESGAVFEVNTGGIYRGYLDEPYPAPFLLRRLAELQAPITLSSDSHDTASLDYGFGSTSELLKACGHKTVLYWKNGQWDQWPL